MSAILPLGDPRLRRKSAAIDPQESLLEQYLQDLATALHSFKAAHGWGRAVALPQLGVASRAIVFDLGSGPFFALNPVIEWLSPETFEVWDDCMCEPNIAVRVLRARSLTLSFVDETMRKRRLERVAAELSELIQHEVDHLDGIVFTDRMIPEWGVISRRMREVAIPVSSAVEINALQHAADRNYKRH